MVDERRSEDTGREGAAGRGDGGGRDYRNRIFEHTQEAKEEAQMLATSLTELSHDVSSYLRVQMRERPWAVLGVAAGFGYVVGGGLASRITRSGLSIATRIGMGVLVRQLAEGHTAAFAGGGGGESSEVGGVGDTGV